MLYILLIGTCMSTNALNAPPMGLLTLPACRCGIAHETTWLKVKIHQLDRLLPDLAVSCSLRALSTINTHYIVFLPCFSVVIGRICKTSVTHRTNTIVMIFNNFAEVLINYNIYTTKNKTLNGCRKYFIT